nr:MAG TPA: Hemin uptake protein hemP [Caudoviricetes sp.]
MAPDAGGDKHGSYAKYKMRITRNNKCANFNF